MFSEAITSAQLPPTLTQADMILFLKKGKPSDQHGSYRPKALINTDAKLLAKMLAAQPAPIYALIHPDQAAFFAGRGVACNLQTVATILYNSVDQQRDTTLCLVNVAKAFDSLKWTFMWQVLRGFGFGPQFISYFQLLYQIPVNRICTGKYNSPFSQLQRGTRQGLFILAMETLAANIRNSAVIHRVIIQDRTIKALLFADDLLLSVSQPDESIPEAFHLLEVFAGL